MAIEANLKRYLPLEMLEVFGKNLPGIIDAVNNSHEKVEQLIQACIDQLYLPTASGRYLVQLGEEQGFIMPANSGLDIRSYRALVPIMVSDPKQVRISIDKLIRVFYGSERVRANIYASVIGPYSLQNGDNLIIETEKGLTTVTILEGQVSNLSNVTASEIAAVLNSVQSTVLAESVTDRATGNDYLRIISSTIGGSGFIRIAGGTLQNVLKFQDVINTENSAGTVWNITKDSITTDLTRFTWNGAGINPNVYLTKSGDVVTIRGLVDGSEDFSNLNGSYEIVNAGYDYFEIRNSIFDVISSSYTQLNDNEIIFTSNKKHILFDQPEYALTSETDVNTITVTVPAIPPLARRFLAGSAHLHGFERQVIDFTRNTIQIQLNLNELKPTDDNLFLLKGKRQRYDFRKKFYKTVISDTDPAQPTYILDSTDSGFALFPYTIATLIGSNPVTAQIGSDVYTISYPYAHGLQYAWGFTLSGGTGIANISSANLNKEHQVFQVINDNTVKFKIKDSLGQPIKFSGIPWSVADVYRHSSDQLDGSDFYLEFANAAAAVASGLTPGITFRLNTMGGTNIDPFYGNSLRYIDLVVTSVVNERVNFISGFGVGATGLIITSIDGFRSGVFGGSLSYYLDKTSNINQDRVLNNLKSLFVNFTAEQNPDYLGAYLFDPTGEKSSNTVSKFVVQLNDNIQRGDNIPALFVNASSVNGEDFPQSGEIIIDYGTDKIEGPIKYYAVISNISVHQILIDPAYKFKKSHDVGANVQYIHQKQPYKPAMDGSDLPFYLTGTNEARNTLFTLIELLVAAGIFVERDIKIPELRYSDISISPFA